MTTDQTSNMSDDDRATLKIWLSEMLDHNTVTVTFLKKDGSERIMKCTTNKKSIPEPIVNEDTESKAERKHNDEVKPVYDLDAKAWRSFRWDAVKRIEFNIGGTDEA